MVEIIGSRGGGGDRRRRPIIRTFNRNRSSTNRTTRMRIQPHIDTRSMEAMLAHTQLLHFFPINENRQANWTLASNILHMGLLLILDIRNRFFILSWVLIDARKFPRIGPAPPPERTRGALDREKEGVDQGRDGDNSEETKNELERRQIYASGRCREGWGFRRNEIIELAQWRDSGLVAIGVVGAIIVGKMQWIEDKNGLGIASRCYVC
ncbi:hypothetical protein GH714_010852 [Hevea brasiliensis]|uniref:Uncharacterized protein n=1 Tax=Hevea brasiliensis TaxID=3981 RepID=A0A6A6KK81_HEVBR|nr:hypothetical protein GH714_010852 [Hevea brasiliensis]